MFLSLSTRTTHTHCTIFFTIHSHFIFFHAHINTHTTLFFSFQNHLTTLTIHTPKHFLFSSFYSNFIFPSHTHLYIFSLHIYLLLYSKTHSRNSQKSLLLTLIHCPKHTHTHPQTFLSSSHPFFFPFSFFPHYFLHWPAHTTT
jgi:hypothetical protein